MGSYQAGSGRKPILIIGSVVLGFFIGEIVTLVARVPGLLRPGHWSGLGALLISAAVLYLVIALYFLIFYVMLRLISLIFRLRFTAAGTALITVLTALPFLVLQNALQRKILGKFIGLTSPRFYVPTAIAMVIMVVFLAVLYLLTRGIKVSPAWFRWITDRRALVAIGFVVFVLYTSLAVTPINVLGVFPEDKERMPTMEYRGDVLREARADSPNFIVLKIEAFRSDEFKPENAPFLWQLAQDNIWFTNYCVVAPATRASVTSFFTSLYPVQHASYDQPLVGRTGAEMVIRSVAVAESIQTVPRLLQRHGYHTFEVTSNDATLDRMFGFADVFHRFDAIDPYQFRVPSLDPLEGYRFLKTYTTYWRVLKIIVVSPEHSWTYFDAPRVNETVKREIENHLEQSAGRPFFLYVHYMEPHSPYYRHPYPALHVDLYSVDRRENIMDAYRSEIGAIDRSIESLYGFLEDKGLLENTYVFVSADHGEEFHDHGRWGHGKSVYPEVMKVPAILVPPSGLRVSKRIDHLVENIDVMPTFAELAGVQPWPFWEGQSLVALIEGEGKLGAEEPRGLRDVAFGQFNDARRFFWASAIRENWQVIFREPGREKASGYAPRKEGRSIMLFNLAEDPLAKHDLYGQGLDVEEDLVALLDNQLTMLEATAHLFRGEETEIDRDRLEQLKTLGYIQ